MATSKEFAFERLRAAHGNARLGHAYLVTGLAGSGKSWLAAQMAGLVLGCEPSRIAAHPDAHFVAPESKSRRIVIEQIRTLEQSLQRTALRGTAKVAVIREADRLQPQAANAFLKTLEEPPREVLLILTSSLPEAMLETILSRCVEISLLAEPGAPSPGHEAIAAALEDSLLVKPSHSGVTDAFRLTRFIQQILSESREKITEDGQEILKAEAARYKLATEGGGWLAEREQQLKAQAEAEAIRERDLVLQTIFGILAEALRRQQGAAGPENSLAEALAARFSTKDLLAKLDALELLRRRLAQGVQETLALESGFLEMILSQEE